MNIFKREFVLATEEEANTAAELCRKMGSTEKAARLVREYMLAPGNGTWHRIRGHDLMLPGSVRRLPIECAVDCGPGVELDFMWCHSPQALLAGLVCIWMGS